jgi:hypothetical protein
MLSRDTIRSGTISRHKEHLIYRSVSPNTKGLISGMFVLLQGISTLLSRRQTCATYHLPFDAKLRFGAGGCSVVIASNSVESHSAFYMQSGMRDVTTCT